MADDFKEKLRSLNFGLPQHRDKPKVTVDHTDQTVNTVTEHWNDRQDVHVRVVDPIKER